MLRMTFKTYCKEKPPLALLGVGTMIQEISDSSTAFSASSVAVSFLPKTFCKRRATPGSKLTKVPVFMPLTILSSGSTPITWCPAAARQIAKTWPTLPKPKTETRFIELFFKLMFSRYGFIYIAKRVRPETIFDRGGDFDKCFLNSVFRQKFEFSPYMRS